MKCKQCGKEHENKSFCSRACRNKYHRNTKNHNPIYKRTPPGIIALNDDNLKKFQFYLTENNRYRSLVLRKSYKVYQCKTCNVKFLGTVISKKRQYCSAKCSAVNKNTKEKRVKTCKEKYGVHSVACLKSVREKYRKTCLERYSKMNVSGVDSIKRKKKSTHRKNYGVDYPFQRSGYKERIIKKLNATYGTDAVNVSQIPEIREKVEKTCMKKYGVPCSFQLSKTGKNFSEPEKEIQSILKDMEIDYIPNDRTIVRNPLNNYMLELDIWIPSLNKAIEFNGDYWHSFNKVKERDRIKLKECEKLKIDLMIIQEKSWTNNKDECIKNIRSFIGETTKIPDK